MEKETEKPTTKRILIVICRYPPSIGGSQRVAYELSQSFRRQGHHVTVAASTSLTNTDVRGFSTGKFFSLHSTCKESHVELLDGIAVHRFEPSFQFWPYLYNPCLNTWLTQNAKNFDAIHVHGYQSYELHAVSRLGLPYVLTAHDIVPHYGGVLALLKYTFDLLIGRRALKRAQHLIALTPENKTEYLHIHNDPEKISIIPNGINPVRPAQKDKALLKKWNNPSRVVLFVARLVKYKGAQYIIEAIPHIRAKYPNTTFVFVGPDGGYEHELKTLARKTGVSEWCSFEGPVADVNKYYNTADLFIFPSTGEGFGISPLEAMSAGVPCILANVGGLNYILAHIGGHPLDMTGDDIALQISRHALRLLRDPKKQPTLMRRARAYTWTSVGKKTLDVLL